MKYARMFINIIVINDHQTGILFISCLMGVSILTLFNFKVVFFVSTYSVQRMI